MRCDEQMFSLTMYFFLILAQHVLFTVSLVVTRKQGDSLSRGIGVTGKKMFWPFGHRLKHKL